MWASNLLREALPLYWRCSHSLLLGKAHNGSLHWCCHNCLVSCHGVNLRLLSLGLSTGLHTELLNLNDYTEKKKAHTTTTERNAFGELFWPQRKTFQAGGGYKIPIQTRKAVSTTEIFPLWTPFFCKEEKFCTGAGRCMVSFPSTWTHLQNKWLHSIFRNNLRCNFWRNVPKVPFIAFCYCRSVVFAPWWICSPYYFSTEGSFG